MVASSQVAMVRGSSGLPSRRDLLIFGANLALKGVYGKLISTREDL